MWWVVLGGLGLYLLDGAIPGLFSSSRLPEERQVVPVAVAAQVPAVERLDTLLASLLPEQGAPTVLAAVVRGEGLIAAGASSGGAREGAAPLSVESRLPLGSTLEPMAVTVIGSLVEEGGLRWESRPAEVLPERREEMGREMAETTLRELLSSPSVFSRSGAEGESLRQSGFPWAMAMAERASGRRWEQLVEERLFRPLGIQGARDGQMSVLGLAKFAELHLRGLQGVEGLVLEPEAMHLLHEPRGEASLGWSVRVVQGHAVSTYRSEDERSSVALLVSPTEDVALVVVAAADGEAGERAVSRTLERLVGRYGLPSKVPAGP